MHLSPWLRAGRGPEDLHRCALPPPRPYPHPGAHCCRCREADVPPVTSELSLPPAPGPPKGSSPRHWESHPKHRGARGSAPHRETLPLRWTQHPQPLSGPHSWGGPAAGACVLWVPVGVRVSKRAHWGCWGAAGSHVSPQTWTTVPPRPAASRPAPTAPAATSVAATPATGSAPTAARVRVSPGGPRFASGLWPGPCSLHGCSDRPTGPPNLGSPVPLRGQGPHPRPLPAQPPSGRESTITLSLGREDGCGGGVTGPRARGQSGAAGASPACP